MLPWNVLDSQKWTQTSRLPCLGDRISHCSPGWPGPQAVLLHQPPSGWSYRCELPRWVRLRILTQPAIPQQIICVASPQLRVCSLKIGPARPQQVWGNSVLSDGETCREPAMTCPTWSYRAIGIWVCALSLASVSLDREAWWRSCRQWGTCSLSP